MEHIKAMCGGSQAHQFRCSDGHNYVVKYQNNKQSPRILVNEVIGSYLANWIGVSTPELRFVSVPSHLAEAGAMKSGGNKILPSPELALGSRVPKEYCYDYVPDPHIERCVNRYDLIKIVAADIYAANGDVRQCIWTSKDNAFTVHMIDFGYYCGGNDWSYLRHYSQFWGNNRYQNMVRPPLLEELRQPDSLEKPRLRIAKLRRSHFRSILDPLPASWFDHEQPSYLIDLLMERKEVFRHMLADWRKETEANWSKDHNSAAA